MNVQDKLATLSLLSTARDHEGTLIWQRFNIFIVVEIAFHSFIFSQRYVFEQAFVLGIKNAVFIIMINVAFCLMIKQVLKIGILHYKKLSSIVDRFEIMVDGENINPFVDVKIGPRKWWQSPTDMIVRSINFVIAIDIIFVSIIILN